MSRILSNPVALLSIFLILVGAGALGLREDLRKFRRDAPRPAPVYLPHGTDLVPEYDRRRVGTTFMLRPAARGTTDAVRGGIESIRVAGSVKRELTAANYADLWELLNELDSRGEFEAYDAAMKSFLTSPAFTTRIQQEHFLRYVEQRPFRVITSYVSRRDYAAACRQIKRMASWFERWNPPPYLPRSNYQLQALINVVYRLDAQCRDLRLFFRNRDDALVILRNTLDGRQLEPATLRYLANSATSEVRMWSAYLVGAQDLRYQRWESGLQAFHRVIRESKNERLRDLAVLGAVRAHYWRAKHGEDDEIARARAAIQSLKPAILRRNLVDDVDHYLAEIHLP